MSFADLTKIYDKQDLEVKFICLEDDGTTRVDLSPPGYVEFRLWREGTKPFDVVCSSEDAGTTDWGDPSTRANGEGVMTVPLQDLELPSGICRMQLRSVDVDNRSRVQTLSFARVVATK